MSRRTDPGNRHLELRLLGKPNVYLDGTAVAGFRTAKAEALLYYLAVTGQQHSRETLAALLWGEMPEGKAKRNLTQILSLLRKRFEPFLVIEPQQIGFKGDSNAWLDVAEFERTLKSVDPEKSPEQMTEAVELYRGDFLEGFYVKDALPFEEWALTRREHARDLVLHALQTLVAEAIARGDNAAGLEYATRLLTLEPWDETAHRQMMVLLARSGRREAALTQYETCRRLLADELGVEPMPETTALYERLKAAETPPPHNLPPPPNIFVGRDAELQHIERQLADPACRLVTVVGPGGIGKTRLTLQAGRGYIQTDSVLREPDLSDGVYFVSLAAVGVGQASIGAADLSSTLVSAIADAVGFSFHGSADPQQQLLNYLSQKSLLLILDNFEHLLALPDEAYGGDEEAGIDLVAAILRQAPRLKLLVTSRERLNLQEEWVIEVAGLTYPRGEAGVQGGKSDAHGTVIDEQMATTDAQTSNFQAYSAVTLFAHRAEQILPDFALNETETPHVVRICQLVAGLPLALELAASWLRVFTCAEIVAEIERSLDFLSTSLRNVPTRHRSLRAVFEYSWAMLTRPEQALFSKLSIFQGGFTREAAIKVGQTSPATLARLVDKSLLRRNVDGRYELHELLRQYATEKLWGLNSLAGDETESMAETAEASLAVWQRYSHYYLKFVSRQSGLLSSGVPQHTLATIRLDLDNIRQAWQWAVTEKWIAELQMSIDGLSRFYDHSGLFLEAAQIFGQAADFLHKHRPPREDDSNLTYQAVTARLWIEQARFLTRRGLAEQAYEIVTRAGTLAETLQDSALIALVAQQQGECLQYLGRYPAAYQQLEQALALAQTAQLPAVVSKSQLDLGIVSLYQGRLAKAQNWLKQAQQGFQTLGDQRSLNIVLLSLGGVAVHLGDHQASRRHFEQALRQARDMGDLWVEGMLLNNLGVLAYEEGRYTYAQTSCQQSLSITRRLMDKANESMLLHSLANIARDLGDFVAAQRCYHQCLDRCRERDDRDTESYALADMGLLFHYLDDQETARDCSLQAITLAEALETTITRSLGLTHLGHVLLANGETTGAIDAYAQAIALRREYGELHRAIESRAGLAGALLAKGELLPALAEIEAVLAYLSGQSLTGIIEPCRVYLTCYRVLQANKDSRTIEVLDTAYNLLQARAEAIEDEQLRRTYLHNIPAHRELLAEFQQKVSG